MVTTPAKPSRRHEVAPGVYQVAIVGPTAAAHGGVLRKAITRSVNLLGIPAASTLRFLTQRTLRGRDARYPLVAVYFGGPTPRPKDVLDAEFLAAEDAAVLPAVPTLQGFGGQVPVVLRGVNGYALDDADPELFRIALWVVEALSLVRERRFSFISYRRDESTRAALQLHQMLDARGWRSFLDTHAVRPGADFQQILWDRMNDSDLLILLDSPGALKREWVKEEVARADQIGMGVLQLVWPGHRRDPCSAFSDPVYLDAADFRPGKLTRVGGVQLRTAKVDAILVQAERLPARSLAARRDRMVRTFTARARLAGLSPVLRDFDRIDVTGKQGDYCVTPVVGHVDSSVAFKAERRFGHAVKPVLLYDDIGLLQERIDHIQWLDKHLPVKSVAAERVADWARLA